MSIDVHHDVLIDVFLMTYTDDVFLEGSVEQWFCSAQKLWLPEYQIASKHRLRLTLFSQLLSFSNLLKLKFS